jgi:hypothetical protein
MTEHDVILVPASELAELRRDAERYRWSQKNAVIVAGWPDSAYASHEAFGAAIDAAIEAEKQADK